MTKRHNSEGLRDRIVGDVEHFVRSECAAGKTDGVVAAEATQRFKLTPPLAPSSVTRWRARQPLTDGADSEVTVDQLNALLGPHGGVVVPKAFVDAYARLEVATRTLAAAWVKAKPRDMSPAVRSAVEEVLVRVTEIVGLREPTKTSKQRAA